MIVAAASCGRQSAVESVSYDVALDSIILSDPCVLADSASGLYYMTGTGGRLYKSPDLKSWAGPYDVVEFDTASWTGSHPAIWAAELHHIGDKYYYFATFTNESLIADSVRNLPRRASAVFVSDSPDGPYRPAGSDYLPADKLTLDGTYWEENGKKYMVYCGEWVQNDNGTIESIELTDDLGGSVDSTACVLFRASDSPWSREVVDGKELGYNRVTDGPWLFRTATGRLGMIWTSWIYHTYTMGVAYSESGTLAGPWVQVAEPVMPADYGHGMIFRDFEGRDILSLHSHSDVNGRYIRRPTFWRVDLSGDSLRVVDRL